MLRARLGPAIDALTLLVRCPRARVPGDAGPQADGPSVSWVEDEPAPVWLDLAREHTEGWTHQQQIREAVGRPGLTVAAF